MPLTERQVKRLTERSHAELVKIMDQLFSLWRRYGESDARGYCNCITCGKGMYWRDPSVCNAGHYISRRKAGKLSSVRWMDDNVWPQCTRCNRHLGGRPAEYRDKLIEKGIDVERIEDLARQTDVWDRQQLFSSIEHVVEQLEGRACGVRADYKALTNKDYRRHLTPRKAAKVWP